MGSSNKAQTVGYKYYLGMHLVLCHGPVDAVTRITVDGKVAWSGNATGGAITINAPELFGGKEREGGVSGTVDVEMGGPTQGRNAYLQSRLGNSIPAFRGVLALVLRQCYLGNNPYLKRWSVRGKRINIRQNGTPQWYLAKANVLGDMNPAHIIREVLTDPDWGMGYPEADMDAASFTSAADQLYSEGMGISLLWDKQQELKDFLATILKHIDGSLFVNRTTGLFTLKLARGGYSVPSLPLFDEQVIERVTDFKRMTVAELTNTVSVIFWDKTTGKNNSVTVQDVALTASQQASVGTTVQYPGFTNGTIATQVAARDLKVLSTPLASATLYVTRKAADLNIGDVFRFSWAEYGVTQLVMRVVNVELGALTDNLIKLSVVEDAFSLGSAIYSPPPPSEWVDPIGVPLPVTQRMLTEVPYFLLAREMGDSAASALPPTATYMMVAGGNPGNGVISAQVQVNEGPGYVQQNVMSFCPTAVLQSAVGPGVTSFSIASGVDLDLVEANSLCVIGTGANNTREWCQVVSITDTTLVVKRGMLDTTPPPTTAAGTVILFIGMDEYSAELPNEYAVGETIKTKLLTTTPKGTLNIASAAEDTLVAVGRQDKPYPPGQLRINTARYPTTITGALTVGWAHRNRLQQTAQTLVDQEAGSLTPEAGTTYTLRLYGETGVLRRTETGLTGTSYVWSTEGTDSGLSGDVSLLHFNGTNGSTTFTDESGIAWSASGNAALTTTSPKFGSACGTFDGSGDYIRSTSQQSGYALGSGDFTIEFFLKAAVAQVQTYPACFVLSASGTHWATGNIVMHVTRPEGGYTARLTVWVYSYSTTAPLLIGTTDVRGTVWKHVAVTRQGNTWRLFVDGTAEATVTFTGSVGVSNSYVYLGGSSEPTAGTVCQMDEARISKGIARYTANFTPPTAELTFVGGGLNSSVRVELESVRDGLTSQFMHNYTVSR